MEQELIEVEQELVEAEQVFELLVVVEVSFLLFFIFIENLRYSRTFSFSDDIMFFLNDLKKKIFLNQKIIFLPNKFFFNFKRLKNILQV